MTYLEQIALIKQQANEAIERINNSKQEAIAEIKKSQEPLPFPIGTPIEVEDHFNNVIICYYNGVCDGIHTGVYCKNSIGTNKGFTINIDTARKVGE